MSNQNEAIFHLIDDIVKTHDLTREEVAGILKYALTKAYNKIYTDKIITVDVDFENKVFLIKEELKVVDRNYYDENGNDDCEIPLDLAKKDNPNVKVGDVIIKAINPRSFEPTMIRSVLQLFKQKVSETINEKIYSIWKDKKGTIISGKVEMTDPNKNFSFVEFENTKGFISASDKIPGEILEIGKSYKFYVKDVKEQTKGWPIILSRSDSGFIAGLIKLEVPEVAQDLIKIRSISRIAGFKTKIAVESTNHNLDPVATCIGQRRVRVEAVTREINNAEKIEFLKYYDDPIKFIASACLPSRIDGVEIISNEEKSATIVAPKDSLSLIIGQKGKNISLISRLTKWNIDVKSRQEAIRENIEYTPIELTFYERERQSKPYIHQFASTDDILKNLQESSSYEQVEKTFNIKDNESNDLTNNKTQIDPANVNVSNNKFLDEFSKAQQNNELSNNSVPKQDLKFNKTDKTEDNLEINSDIIKSLQDKLNGNIEDNSNAIINENKKSKVDYSKLMAFSDTKQINSLEKMLSEKKNSFKPKSNFKRKDNKNRFEQEKPKKKNILDEFDDVTKDYLLNDNTDIESYEDDSDDYDDYDLDEYNE